ncbi:MAG: phosphate/phosphite/phosphonate ABC transporter substrate-binding protein [Hyphomicrobiaceae bacterium]
MMKFKRAVLSVMAALGVVTGAVHAYAQDKLRFAVGPFQPTPSDTRKAYEPFFKHLAEKLGRPYEMVVTNDWAGISVALANGQADIAWMGPWGYVLAHHNGGAEAIATVKYDGKPTYHAIILSRPGLNIAKWPDDAKGLKLSLADVGSTSGWLIPTHYFMQKGIDPKTYFQYRDGASHAANVTAVASSQVDLASDYDRNFNAMVEKGIVKKGDVNIAWTSDPLPNDPLVVRKGFDADLAAKLQQALLEITEEQALTLMPKHYTGWVKADHGSYKLIEDAGIAVGRIKPQQ